MFLTYLDNKCGNWFSNHPILILVTLIFVAIIVTNYGQYRLTTDGVDRIVDRSCQERIKNTAIANIRTHALLDMFDTYTASRIEQAKWGNLTAAQRKVILNPVIRWKVVDRPLIKSTRVTSC